MKAVTFVIRDHVRSPSWWYVLDEDGTVWGRPESASDVAPWERQSPALPAAAPVARAREAELKALDKAVAHLTALGVMGSDSDDAYAAALRSLLARLTAQGGEG